MSWKVHLSRNHDPNEITWALCGIGLTHPVKVPLTEEERSPLDHPRLCKTCRKTAELKGNRGLTWESGVIEGQESMENASE